MNGIVTEVSATADYYAGDLLDCAGAFLTGPVPQGDTTDAVAHLGATGVDVVRAVRRSRSINTYPRPVLIHDENEHARGADEHAGANHAALPQSQGRRQQ